MGLILFLTMSIPFLVIIHDLDIPGIRPMKGDVKKIFLPPRLRELLEALAIQTLVVTGTLPILQNASDSHASFARPPATRNSN